MDPHRDDRDTECAHAIWIRVIHERRVAESRLVVDLVEAIKSIPLGCRAIKDRPSLSRSSPANLRSSASVHTKSKNMSGNASTQRGTVDGNAANQNPEEQRAQLLGTE